MTGVLALSGTRMWDDGALDRELLEIAGGKVTVVPTAAAYEQPHDLVRAASTWFEGLGATVTVLPVFARADAADPEHATTLAGSRFVALLGSSPMHLISVFKATPLVDALHTAWTEGGAIEAWGGVGAPLCDPMVDPRGGAFTVGLPMLSGMAFLPDVDRMSPEAVERTARLAPSGVPVVAAPAGAAVIRRTPGRWEALGEVTVHLNGQTVELDTLTA